MTNLPTSAIPVGEPYPGYDIDGYIAEPEPERWVGTYQGAKSRRTRDERPDDYEPDYFFDTYEADYAADREAGDLP